MRLRKIWWGREKEGLMAGEAQAACLGRCSLGYSEQGPGRAGAGCLLLSAPTRKLGRKCVLQRGKAVEKWAQSSLSKVKSCTRLAGRGEGV